VGTAIGADDDRGRAREVRLSVGTFGTFGSGSADNASPASARAKDSSAVDLRLLGFGGADS
jgi:hypothetical protein